MRGAGGGQSRLPGSGVRDDKDANRTKSSRKSRRGNRTRHNRNGAFDVPAEHGKEFLAGVEKRITG